MEMEGGWEREGEGYVWGGGHVVLLDELGHAGPGVDPVEVILAGGES